MSAATLRRRLKDRMKRAAVSLLGRDPRVIAGSVLARLYPDRYAQLIASFYTEDAPDFVSRMLRHKINHDYYLLGDERSREWNIKSVWGDGDAGLKWHLDNERRAREDFASQMRFKLIFLDALKEFLLAHPHDTLVEIGTGTGFFLDYICERLADSGAAPQRYIGIDLSSAAIRLANERNRRANVTYAVVTDTERFAREKCGPRTVFIALGTLEFFRYDDLVSFARLVKSKPSSAIAICEPVNMDLATETASNPRGNLMYSHNYPRIFTDAGFKLSRCDTLPISDTDPHYVIVLLIGRT